MFTTPIRAGDSWQSLQQLAAYPADDGWVAKLRLVPRAAGAAIELTAAASGAAHLFSASAATTADWSAGAYTWALWVVRGAEVVTIGSDQLAVTPNLRTLAAGHDGRSLASKTLEDLLAARASWVTTNGRIRSYSINGRQQEFTDAAQLNAEIAFWQAQVNAEKSSAHLAAGRPSPGRILTRYQRPR